MAVKIRLARFGRKGVPFYHVVVSDPRRRRDSNFIERIGGYNPLLDDGNKEKLRINKERAEYWLSVGAKPTERVAILLIKSSVSGADKYKPVYTSQKPPKKAKGEGDKK